MVAQGPGSIGIGRSPHGERGLKSVLVPLPQYPGSRSPHGERGLKSLVHDMGAEDARSLPSRGAWIEIVESDEAGTTIYVAPLTGSVD